MINSKQINEPEEQDENGNVQTGEWKEQKY